MRSKLLKFTDFTSTLLPHETEYLLSIQQFKDDERLAILRRIDHNARQIDQFTAFDLDIDKRKYNHLQNWIQERLRAVDVYEQLRWMLATEQQIMTDSIEMDVEKTLLKMVKASQQPVFFTKFYELVAHYRHFLLIRLRYLDHQLVDQYLKKYREAYLRSKAVHEKLHDATLDIVGQYAGQAADSRQWEDWLTTVFYDESLDGQTRYLALVRLTFLGYNYRQYDALKEKFAYLEQQFFRGEFYSRRLLANYYNNQLMLHSHYGNYEQAAYFGYLSVRTPNHDYPLYVNNLCAVLLRLGRHPKALQLMKTAAPQVKKTSNLHNRVSFVAFYMEALNKNGLYKNAESYGAIFLKAYAKEVLQYRWHLFFSVYLEAMLFQHQYERMLKVEQKYQLLRQDKAYRSNANYLPIVHLFIALARFHEGILERPALLQMIAEYQQLYQDDPTKSRAFANFRTKIGPWLP